MIGYKLDLKNKLKLNIAAGEYFAYGLNGRFNNLTGTFVSLNTENGQFIDIDELPHNTLSYFYGKTFEHLYNRFDTGLILSIGAEYRRFTLTKCGL